MKTVSMKLEMIKFDKILDNILPAFRSKFSDIEKFQTMKDSLPTLEEFFTRNMNGENYLSGTSEPMMIDIHCFPRMERAVMLEGSVKGDSFIAMQFGEVCPSVYAWVHRFRENEKFSSHCITQKAYNKYLNLTLASDSKVQLNHAMLEE